jgi:hypothetical protein
MLVLVLAGLALLPPAIVSAFLSPFRTLNVSVFSELPLHLIFFSYLSSFPTRFS